MKPTSASSAESSALEARFGRLVAARLNAGNQNLPHDISERLRAGRMQALARRKLEPRVQMAPVLASAGGAATLGAGGNSNTDWGWFTRLGTVLPLIALVAGLITISAWQDDNSTTELADVDAALLTDDLPPAAYTDPGFAQFLRHETATR